MIIKEHNSRWIYRY